MYAEIYSIWILRALQVSHPDPWAHIRVPHMCSVCVRVRIHTPTPTYTPTRVENRGQRGRPHPGCRLRTSWICPIPCTHTLPNSALRASVKIAFLIMRTSVPKKTITCIRFRNEPCVHPFSVSLKTNICIQTSETWILTTGRLRQE